MKLGIFSRSISIPRSEFFSHFYKGILKMESLKNWIAIGHMWLKIIKFNIIMEKCISEGSITKLILDISFFESI